MDLHTDVPLITHVNSSKRHARNFSFDHTLLIYVTRDVICASSEQLYDTSSARTHALNAAK